MCGSCHTSHTSAERTGVTRRSCCMVCKNGNNTQWTRRTSLGLAAARVGPTTPPPPLLIHSAPARTSDRDRPIARAPPSREHGTTSVLQHDDTIMLSLSKMCARRPFRVPNDAKRERAEAPKSSEVKLEAPKLGRADGGGALPLPYKQARRAEISSPGRRWGIDAAAPS